MNLIPVEAHQYVNADHIVSFHYTPATTQQKKVGQDNWGDPVIAQVSVEGSIRITMSTGKDHALQRTAELCLFLLACSLLCRR